MKHKLESRLLGEISITSDMQMTLLWWQKATVKVKVIQPYLTLNYTVHGILQARILEWVAVPFSRRMSHPGIEPRSPTLQADSLPAEPQKKPKTKSNEGLNSLLMKVKEESQKAGLKLNIQKTKITASGPITSWQIDGETMETVTDFIFLGSKITGQWLKPWN